MSTKTLQRPTPTITQPFHLTNREFEVAKLIAEGKQNSEIAKILGISPRTVSTHAQHLFSRLRDYLHFDGKMTRTKFASFMVREGIVVLPRLLPHIVQRNAKPKCEIIWNIVPHKPKVWTTNTDKCYR